MELFKNTNFDFLGKKWPFIIASLILTAAGLVSLVARGGPRYGIDFRGGALVYVKFAEKPMPDKVRAALASKIPGGGAPEVVEVQGTNELIIGTEIQDEKTLAVTRQAIGDTLAKEFGQESGSRLDINNASTGAVADRLRDVLPKNSVNLSEQQLQDLAKAITTFRDTPPQSGLIRNFEQLSGVPGVTPPVIAALNQEFFTARYAIRGVELVGAKIGADLRRQAVYVVLSALGGMLIYIAFRFEWIYGVAAVLAVFHDTIITLGLFSIFNMEISLTVVAALLTLVGYSMNDTVVVFDRIRENLKLLRREKLENLINISINQTLSRTVLASGLTFLTAVSLFLFGGPVLKGFSFALVVGIIVGTYSSIFIASPILVVWQDFVEKRKGNASALAAGAARRR
ncbi:MAG: protein translocase subunit SecF [Bryobacteraceae bacterium]